MFVRRHIPQPGEKSALGRVTIQQEMIFALCRLLCVKVKNYSLYSFSEVYIVSFVFLFFFEFWKFMAKE